MKYAFLWRACFAVIAICIMLYSYVLAFGEQGWHLVPKYEHYYQKERMILAKVNDKKSADVAAHELRLLRQRPEYTDLYFCDRDSFYDERLQFYDYDFYSNEEELSRLKNELFFQSSDLAKILYSDSYQHKLLKVENVSEDVLSSLASHLFEEMGNISGGGPGFTTETAWKVDSFDNFFPIIDRIPMHPGELFSEVASARAKTELFLDNHKYVEYELDIIYQGRRYIIRQWYVSSLAQKENAFFEKEYFSDIEATDYNIYLMLFNSLCFLFEVYIYIRFFVQNRNS